MRANVSKVRVREAPPTKFRGKNTESNCEIIDFSQAARKINRKIENCVKKYIQSDNRFDQKKIVKKLKKYRTELEKIAERDDDNIKTLKLYGLKLIEMVCEQKIDLNTDLGVRKNIDNELFKKPSNEEDAAPYWLAKHLFVSWVEEHLLLVKDKNGEFIKCQQPPHAWS